ncbi:MAG: caspase family protein [archaeon]
MFYPSYPDLTEQKDFEATDLVLYEFYSSYDNKTTKKNIKQAIKTVAAKTNDNDLTVFYILAHGDKSHNLILPDQTLHRLDLGKWLKQINGDLLFVSDACHSADFIDWMYLPNSVRFAGCEKYKSCWSDRNGNSGQIFFEQLNNEENDRNNDGRVDVDEAYESAKKLREEYGESIREFMIYEYDWGDSESPIIETEKCSFSPHLIKGKYADENLSLK